MNEAFVPMHAASHLSQTTMSDENLFQMHIIVWLVGYASLAGYARLAVPSIYRLFVARDIMPSLGRGQSELVSGVECLISEKNPYRNIVKTI